MVKKKIHETKTEIVYEVEEIIPLENNGIYNTTYLAESIICTAMLINGVLVRYLYKEKKPEIIEGVKSITLEYITNYETKKITFENIDDCSVEVINCHNDKDEVKLSFKY